MGEFMKEMTKDNDSFFDYIASDKKEGLTGAKEIVKGFVGKVIKYDKTLGGKPRLTFDLSFGQRDESAGKYETWRHVFLYGEHAVNMKDVKTGDYVTVSGWVSTELFMNEYYEPVKDKDGFPVKIEKLICWNAEKLEYKKKPVAEQLPLAVGQA